MTAHRIRLFHATAGAQSYHDWLDQWLLNMESWESSEVDNTPPVLRSQLDGDSEYYGGDLAFDWSEDMSIILDQLSQYAAAYCDWHRIGYHVCDHDDADASPCAWEETRESGTVPEYVPTL